MSDVGTYQPLNPSATQKRGDVASALDSILATPIFLSVLPTQTPD
jgi:hypothetical protein